MGYVLPPLPLTPEQFAKAWREGKRTMAEIDPAFWEWYTSGQRLHMIGIVAIVLGGMALFIIFAWRALNG